MRRSDMVGMTARILGAYIVVGVLLFHWPSLWLRWIAPWVEVVTAASSPYLQDLQVTNDDLAIHVSGSIHLQMTLVNGMALPVAPGTWIKQGGQSLQVLMIAVALWLAPAVGWRRRLAVLPVMIVVTSLLAACDLSTEIQVTALQYMGSEWLPGLPLAKSEANWMFFQKMEASFNHLRILKSVNDGGGRLFGSVLCGLIGYTIPGRRRVANPSSVPHRLRP